MLLGEFSECIMLHFWVSLKSSILSCFCVSATLAVGMLHFWVSYYIN
jgi:hypothetical protein